MIPILTTGPTPGALTRAIYFPLVMTPPPADPVEPVAIFLNLLTSDRRQERPGLALCPALVTAATWRAQGMATGGDPFAHVDANGLTPNEYCRQAGCRLPVGYAGKGNNVESLGAGTGDAEVMFAALANSPKHSDHLFGRGWFAHQTHVGIAAAQGGVYGWYWCILIAACAGVTSGE